MTSALASQKNSNEKKKTISNQPNHPNRFGSKAEAAALLAEWATRIAPQALGEAGKGSFSSPSVRVLSGAVGASESRLEVEVRGLPSLAALEALWESLPREENRAWQERLARHVVDGSTRWEVFYELGFGGRGGGGEDEARASTSSFSSSPPPPTFSKAETTSSSPSASSSPLLVVSGDEAAAILQVDAATAKAAIEKSTANGSVTDGGASGSANGHPSSAAGRGRPRSLERAAAAAVRARAAAEAAKKRHPASSPPLSSPPSSSPPSPPPIKIGSILGATKSNNGSSGNGFGSDDSDDGGGGGLDPSSKLVPGQRLPDGSVVATDWKGDVMIIRPGDRGIAGL